MRHVREELALVSRRDCQLLGFLLELRLCQLYLSVLALHFRVLLGKQARFLLQLAVGLLQLFLLRAETGLGVREIARITRSLPETTKSRLRYALRELRKAMASWA